jgi:hypothetical protein
MEENAENAGFIQVKQSETLSNINDNYVGINVSKLLAKLLWENPGHYL